jgi:hypothetical protein
MVVDAWRASADMRVGYQKLGVKDIETGRVDPLEMMQGNE